MDYDELLKKYKMLLNENQLLKNENKKLKMLVGLSNIQPPESKETVYAEQITSDRKTNDSVPTSVINNQSDSLAKIKLFMLLFKGRDDVYAKRWENKNKGASGYSPVCLNQWQPGLCSKPKVPCSKCTNSLYAALDENVIENHLRGHFIAGIYPMLSDETCHFLAIDFDEGDWQKDISILRDVCVEHDIPIAVERSRSGDGGHVWFFFADRLLASLARKFGTALLTYSMNRRHEIKFKSYDRFFPSQDTMPKGGFGNLIALPFQKAARKDKNSEFVDENFQSYDDQWAFLSGIQRLSEGRVENLITKLCHGHELGVLKVDEEEIQKPWKICKVTLHKNDFPRQIEIVKANMLFIPKADITQQALNRLKRLASFKNPEFYRKQAMRLSTYGHNRVISCADETLEYLCLPRGCETELKAEFDEHGIDVHFIDKTNSGRKIDVAFNGQLRDEQSLSIEQLMNNDMGILSGTTAFGKTVVAIKLIAEKKVNTLILVDKISLLSQWEARLLEFLIINETLPEPEASEKKKRGRKKKRSIIGQLGGGKNTLTGIVDIAVMQSVSRPEDVHECVKNYGMIIADECHHASAFTYEKILKTTNAKYVYGLTATPTRKDGHHPILFMQCGPIRFRDDAKKQARKRPFEHYIVPRFTSLRVPLNNEEKDVTIQELYAEIVDNEIRNQFIIEDVLSSYKSGRNCIVLTLRTAHVEFLTKKLGEKVPDVVKLTGRMGKKVIRAAFQQIADTPTDKNLIIVATGHLIGEGFDEPRLDTLFLAMPISWKGTLQQYAGRLHRLFENKKEVQVYDYVDIHVKMLEKMYQKRLTGYASMGYKAKGENLQSESLDIIFDKDNFLSVFSNDIVNAKKEVLIVSPYVRKRRTLQMVQYLKIASGKKARVIVVTRPKEDFKEKDQVAIDNALDLLKSNDISIVLKSNIHQKFAIMDQKIVWYGSINLLSYGNAQESMMRIESPNIANELIKRIEGS
ncbi:MAG: DEAD/DEAH box helicase family protein [Desulfobacteraceae bacterium]|nr:DEAD/DEAH box helicase family protein [Desulfobacteraceae bacterium]MBC2756270.1 DEAD/DEAH box helicase family protein [Desulfobacteraceae bacterium]